MLVYHFGGTKAHMYIFLKYIQIKKLKRNLIEFIAKWSAFCTFLIKNTHLYTYIYKQIYICTYIVTTLYMFFKIAADKYEIKIYHFDKKRVLKQEKNFNKILLNVIKYCARLLQII